MEIQEHVALAPFTTLGIGGPARFFVRIATEDNLLEAISFARANHLPTFTLGGGSNVLVRDSGFAGLVLHIAIESDPVLTSRPQQIAVSAAAGQDWDRFTRFVCEHEISGIECLAGIPGLVGSSPVQNIGAYGQEVASTIESVRALDLHTLRFVEIPAPECRFGYRRSIFNSVALGRYIVTKVDFRFERNATPNLAYVDLQKHFGPRSEPTPLQVYQAVREIRARKGMLLDYAHPTPDTRSAGSFFKNPVVPENTLLTIAQTLQRTISEIPHWPVDNHLESTDLGGTVPERAGQAGERGERSVKLAAAWLIEQAGFPKGYMPAPESTVGLSTLHTLALTNRTGDATAKDLLDLRDRIVATVQTRFGVVLHQEPVLVP